MAFLSGIFNKPQQQQPAAPATPVNSNGSAGPAAQQPAPANPGANPQMLQMLHELLR